jgi:hypothetical protein
MPSSSTGPTYRCVWCTALFSPGSGKHKTKHVNTNHRKYKLHFCPQFHIPGRPAGTDYRYPNMTVEVLTEEEIEEVTERVKANPGVKYESYETTTGKTKKAK